MTYEQVLEYIGLEMPKYVLDKYLVPFRIKRDKGVYRNWKSDGGISDALDRLYHSGGAPGFDDDLPTGLFDDWDLPKWHPRYFDVSFRKQCMWANLYKWEVVFRKYGRQKLGKWDVDPIPQYLRKALRSRRIKPKEQLFLDKFPYSVVFGDPPMPAEYYRQLHRLFKGSLNGVKRSVATPEINEQQYRRAIKADPTLVDKGVLGLQESKSKRKVKRSIQ